MSVSTISFDVEMAILRLIGLLFKTTYSPSSFSYSVPNVQKHSLRILLVMALFNLSTVFGGFMRKTFWCDQFQLALAFLTP